MNLPCTEFTYFEYQRICLRQECGFSKERERGEISAFMFPSCLPEFPFQCFPSHKSCPQLVQQIRVFSTKTQVTSNFPCANKKYQVILELKVPLLCFTDLLQIAAEQHNAFGFLGHLLDMSWTTLNSLRYTKMPLVFGRHQVIRLVHKSNCFGEMPFPILS